jgi:predicted MFS family arabinose efflux permease
MQTNNAHTSQPSGEHPPEGSLGVPIRLKLEIGAMLLLVLALGFNALLTISSLEKMYVRTIVSKYHVIGKNLQRDLEKATRFGKSIRKFHGIDRVLKEALKNLTSDDPETATGSSAPPNGPSDITVSVVDLERIILYSTSKALKGRSPPEAVPVIFDQAGEAAGANEELPYIEVAKRYYITFPIRGGLSKKQEATLLITFGKSRIQAILNAVLLRNVKTVLVILASGFLALMLLLHWVTPARVTVATLPRIRISVAVFTVIVAGQLVFSMLNTGNFREHYLTISREKATVLATLLKTDIEYLLKKGVSLDRMHKMDEMLTEVIAAARELDCITILDSDGRRLYSSTQKCDPAEKPFASPAEYGSTYRFRTALTGRDSVRQGYIETVISKKVLLARIGEISLDAATVLVISILFSVEMLIMVFQLIETRIDPRTISGAISYRAMRPAAFLFLFGIDISISFVPLHMEQLYEPLLGLSRDMLIGLPISAEMFCAALSGLVAGNLIDKKGWCLPCFAGLLLSAAGAVYSWLAPDALHFILSRAVTGVGYGMAWMSTMGFVIAFSDENSKAQGLAQLFAGMLAGSICGGAAGAMMAERIGYPPVFLVGGFILLLTVAYIALFMQPAVNASAPTGVTISRKAGIRDVIRFLFDRNVLSVTLFICMPAAVASVGFLNYFSPVYLSRVGASQSNIGRVYMIFGLCLIYIAPLVSRWIDASNNKKLFIVLHGILGSMAFLIFYFAGGLVATALAVFLLGLSFSFDATRAYALKMKVTAELGEGKAMGILSTAEKIGQVLGPVFFGGIILAASINTTIVVFGLAFLFITLLFVLIAQNDKEIFGRRDSGP